MIEHTLVEIENEDDGDVASWSADKVKTWLRHNGHQDLEVCSSVCFRNFLLLHTIYVNFLIMPQLYYRLS